MVELKREPITAAGKSLAVKNASREVFERFAALSDRRSWVAQYLPQRKAMGELGPLLRRDESGWVRNLLSGALATEYSEPHYVQVGIHASGKDSASRSFYENFWGPQERRHWEALRLGLLDSGLMTADEVHVYLRECEESDPWTFEKQTGHSGDDVVWLTAYAAGQEGETNLIYRQSMKIVWEQYGSPRDAETNRIQYPGLSGVLQLIAEDEGAHQGFFLQMMRIYLRYWPDKALEALAGVFNGYKMPVVHIPNPEEFLDAVIRAKLGHPRWVVAEVLTPVAQRLGLESRSAAARALRNFGDLFDNENAVVQIAGKKIDDVPEGCVVYEMHPDGSFVPQAVASS